MWKIKGFERGGSVVLVFIDFLGFVEKNQEVGGI